LPQSPSQLVTFAPRETIHTESSVKYDLARVDSVLDAGGFQRRATFYDEAASSLYTSLGGGWGFEVASAELVDRFDIVQRQLLAIAERRERMQARQARHEKHAARLQTSHLVVPRVCDA
jgi:hypothetical protein